MSGQFCTLDVRLNLQILVGPELVPPGSEARSKNVDVSLLLPPFASLLAFLISGLCLYLCICVFALYICSNMLKYRLSFLLLLNLLFSSVCGPNLNILTSHFYESQENKTTKLLWHHNTNSLFALFSFCFCLLVSLTTKGRCIATRAARNRVL